MKKKDEPYLTLSQRQARKESKAKRRHVFIVILLILSIALNVLQFLHISPFKNIDISIPFLERFFVDNDEFIAFIEKNQPDIVFSVLGDGEKKTYTLANNGDRSTLTVKNNDDFLDQYSCDFSIDKYDELKKIVLSRQLKWYNASEHVDKDGKVVDENEKYGLSFNIYYFVDYQLESPKNGRDIEKFFVDLDAIASDSPDKKLSSKGDPTNTEFMGYFQKVRIVDGEDIYTLRANGDTCEFSYNGSRGDCNCDFVSDKMDELRELLVSNELKWAEDAQEVDSDGKVTYTAYESPYTVELFDTFSFTGKRIETPFNIHKIVNFMKELEAFARN